MGADESDPLLPDAKVVKETKESRHQALKGIIILCFITYFMIQPAAVISYIVNEWTQHMIKQKYFSENHTEIKRESCQSINHSSGSYHNLTKVQQEAAKWIMYNHVASYAPAFFACILIPPYTDSYGRRFLAILSLFGIFLKNLAACIIIYTNQRFIYMVAAYSIEGFTGTSFAFYSVSFSIVADLMTDKTRRVFYIVVVEFISISSSMISAIASGLLVDNCGYSLPAVVCAAMMAISLLLAIFVLPESLKPENRCVPKSFSGNFKRPFEFYMTTAFKSKCLQYVSFLLAFGFMELAALNRTTMETIYLLGAPFCFSPTWVGYFSFARHFGQAIIGLGSVKLMQMCMSNEAIAILSTVTNSASFIVEGFATSRLMIFMVAVIAIFSFLAIPMIRGIMSSFTPADKQGSMFSSLAAIQVIGSILAVTSENTIYSATVSIMNGFVFLVMAGFSIIELILLVIGTIAKRKSDETNKRNDFIRSIVIGDPVNSSKRYRSVSNKPVKGSPVNTTLTDGDKDKVFTEDTKQQTGE